MAYFEVGGFKPKKKKSLAGEVSGLPGEVLPSNALSGGAGIPAPTVPGGSEQGGGSEIIIIRTVAQQTDAYRVIWLEDGTLSDADQSARLNNTVGLTLAAADTGEQVGVLLFGPAKNPAWHWTKGLPVWLSDDGELTQSIPAPSRRWKVADATDTDAVYFLPRLFTQPGLSTYSETMTGPTITIDAADHGLTSVHGVTITSPTGSIIDVETIINPTTAAVDVLGGIDLTGYVVSLIGV